MASASTAFNQKCGHALLLDRREIENILIEALLLNNMETREILGKNARNYGKIYGNALIEQQINYYNEEGRQKELTSDWRILSNCCLSSTGPSFFRQTEVFSQVRSKLYSVETKRLVLTGIAGAGKTLLAQALLNEHLQSYKGNEVNYCIQGDDIESFLSYLQSLAKKLNQSYQIKTTFLSNNDTIASIVETVSEIFKERILIDGSKWALLLDNVNFTHKCLDDIVDLLCNDRACNSTLVITTQHRKFRPDLKNLIRFDLDEVSYNLTSSNSSHYKCLMDDSKAILFGEHNYEHMISRFGEENELENLIKYLNFLPLSLVVAGEYIKQCDAYEKTQYKDYLKHLRSEDTNFDCEVSVAVQCSGRLPYESDNKTKRKTQRSAIRLSIKKILQKVDGDNEVDAQAFKQVLRFCAYLAPDGIAVKMLRDFAQACCNSTLAGVLYTTYRESMIQFSLLWPARMNSEITFSIHRETQRVIRELCRQETEDEFPKFVKVATTVFETNLQAITTIMPHVISFWYNCKHQKLDSNSQVPLEQFSNVINNHLDIQMQKKQEVVAEQLQHSWQERKIKTDEHQNDEEIEAKAQLAAVRAANLFQIPPENDKFVGRDVQLNALSVFFSAKSRQMNVFCIVGSGGMGKTALATACIRQVLTSGQYQNIIWLNAEFPHQLLLQIQSLIKQWYHTDNEEMRCLKHTDLQRMFNEYLSKNDSCIVFDNACEYGSINSYIPTADYNCSKLHIIVTSRNVEWGMKFQPNVVYMEQLSDIEVEEYLLQEIPSGISLDSILETDHKILTGKLNELLGGLPLALVQAVAYMKQNDINIDSYIKLFEQLEFGLFGKDSDKGMLTVQQTLTLAIDKVRQKNRATDAVLSLCAFFGTEEITKELLYAILIKPFNSTNTFMAQLLKFLQHRMTEISMEHKILLVHTLRVSSSSNLINPAMTAHPTKKIFSANPLETPRSSADDLSRLLLIFYTAIAADATMNRKSKASSNAAIETDGVQLSPQDSSAVGERQAAGEQDSQAAAHNNSERNAFNSGTREAEMLAIGGTSRHMQWHDEDRKADQTNQFNLNILNTKLAITSAMDTSAEVQTQLQKTLKNVELALLQWKSVTSRECVDEALEWLQQYSIVALNGNLVRIHRLTQMVMRYIYKKSSLYEETYLQLQEYFLTKLNDIEPKEDNEGSVSAVNSNESGLSNQEHLRVILLWWKVSQHQLGMISDINLAVRCYEKTLEIKIFVSEKRYTVTALTIGDLEAVNNSRGFYATQMNFLAKALPIIESHFGPDHLQTASILNSLGNVCGYLSDYNNQRDLLARSLNIRERRFGSHHPQTAITLMNLANALGNLGDCETKVNLLGRALPEIEMHFGSNHPFTAVAQINLGIAYGKLGQLQKLRDLLGPALLVLDSSYGDCCYVTGIALNYFGDALGRLKNFETAKNILTRALTLNTTHFGMDHPDLATTMYNLSTVFYELKAFETASQYAQKAYEIRQSFYGDSNSVTKAVLERLTQCNNLANASTNLSDKNAADLTTGSMNVSMSPIHCPPNRVPVQLPASVDEICVLL